MLPSPLPRAGRPAKLAALLCASLIVLGALGAMAQEPSPATIATAKEVIEAKGASRMFDPAIPGVVESAKNTFAQTNPGLIKDLNEVAAQLRTEYAGKRSEIADQMARVYAARFSESEIKDVLAFYKSPIGQKVIVQEPQIMEETMNRLSGWADRFADEVMGRFRAEMKKRGHDL